MYSDWAHDIVEFYYYGQSISTMELLTKKPYSLRSNDPLGQVHYRLVVT